jgi:hypothetical protein
MADFPLPGALIARAPILRPRYLGRQSPVSQGVVLFVVPAVVPAESGLVPVMRKAVSELLVQEGAVVTTLSVQERRVVVRWVVRNVKVSPY